jgi:hypothetical protein
MLRPTYFWLESRKRPLGRAERRREDNIKINMSDTWRVGTKFMWNSDLWWTFVNTVMKVLVP